MQRLKQWPTQARWRKHDAHGSRTRARAYKRREAPTHFSLTSESCFKGDDGDLRFDQFSIERVGA